MSKSERIVDQYTLKENPPLYDNKVVVLRQNFLIFIKKHNWNLCFWFNVLNAILNDWIWSIKSLIIVWSWKVHKIFFSSWFWNAYSQACFIYTHFLLSYQTNQFFFLLNKLFIYLKSWMAIGSLHLSWLFHVFDIFYH
jgi:hypothetical protein